MHSDSLRAGMTTVTAGHLSGGRTWAVSLTRASQKAPRAPSRYIQTATPMNANTLSITERLPNALLSTLNIPCAMWFDQIGTLGQTGEFNRELFDTEEPPVNP